jgi:hypothetical protein
MSTGPPPNSTLAVVTGSAAATITIPATSAAIVLDSVYAKMWNQAAAGTSSGLNLSSSDGTFTNYLIGFLICAASATGIIPTDELSLPDLGLMCGPNSSMTVNFSNWTATSGQSIVIGYHYT